MTQKQPGLIEYTTNKFGHVADHSMHAFPVYRSPLLTSGDSANQVVQSVLDTELAHEQLRLSSYETAREQVDSKALLLGLLETLDRRAVAATPTNHRTHHFWREMTLVTPQQG